MSLILGGIEAQTFSKDEPEGTPITSLFNPSVEWLSAEIEKTLQPDVAEKKAGQLQSPLEIRPYTWMLVYENLSGGENFELHYSVNLTRKKDSQLEKYSIASVECKPEPVKAPLAAWEANNYQKVNDVTKTMMEGCMRQFNDMKDTFLQ